MKIRSQKVTWFGVYKKIRFLGNSGRMLEAVVATETEAKAWIENKIGTSLCYTHDEFMIEEVEIKMKAYEC